ncbi:hypothetical protein E1258_02140 [Micromonospora sp. KC207]|nr:hypothetical protein [Micromonospora sp. KC207]TDC66620.1 hypothetical protein E1258_02140 [Micromonospora sp. KC207]
MDIVSGVGSVAARLGLLALALGAITFLITRHRDGLGRALSTTPVLVCAELAQAADPPRRAIVVGRTGPASAGPLRAPISGEECVWYRVVLTSGGPASSFRQRSVYRSSEPFTVADSTGAVEVAPRLADRYLFEDDLYHDLPVALVEITALDAGPQPDVRDRLKRYGFLVPGHRKDVCEISEYRISADQAITVLGRPCRGADGVALTTAWGICGVAGPPLDKLRTSALHHARDIRKITRGVAIGGAALLAAGLLLQVPDWLTG